MWQYLRDYFDHWKPYSMKQIWLDRLSVALFVWAISKILF